MRPFQTALLFATLRLLFPIQAFAADAPVGKPASPPNHVLRLLVVDSGSSNPLSGIDIQLRWAKGDEHFLAKSDGHAIITIPPDATASVGITVSRHGYVGKVLTYGRSGSLADDPPPGEYTLKLDPAKTISGRVLDDAGKPVAGAHVLIQLAGRQPADAHERLDLPYQEGRSATDGKWTFDGAPAEMESASVGAWDYRYAVGAFAPMEKVTSIATLFDGTDVVTLDRGVTVEGTVMTEEGLPAVGASVGIGADRVASNVVPAQKTDGKGHYAYVVAPGSHMVLTAIAEGYAPAMRETDAPKADGAGAGSGAAKTQVNIELNHGKRLSGKVVGPDGKPVADAYIYLDSWRNFRTIGRTLRTDSNGEFSWEQAPADEMIADVGADGFAEKRSVSMVAGDKPVIVTLRGALHVHGTVVDAVSGKAIDHFRLIPEITFRENSPPFPRSPDRPSVPKEGGKFQYSDVSPYPFFAVRIEADGYAPSESRLFTAEEGDVSLEFKLKKGEGMVVKVLAPDGSPAAGITGVQCLPGYHLNLVNGQSLLWQDETKRMTADASGQISLPPQMGDFLLVLFGAKGYAEVDQDALAKSNTATIGAWGHIHGKLILGGKPAANEAMSIELPTFYVSGDPAPVVTHQISFKSDGQGNFAFDRVPPGEVQIGRMVDVPVPVTGTIGRGQDPQVKLEMTAGQSVEMQIGGKGRVVTGKAILPPEMAAKGDWSWQFSMLTSKPTEADNPAQRKHVQMLAISRDGVFRAEDLRPGEYEYMISARSAASGNGDSVGDAGLAQGSVKFTVSPGAAEVPVEVPDVQMKLSAGSGQALP